MQGTDLHDYCRILSLKKYNLKPNLLKNRNAKQRVLINRKTTVRRDDRADLMGLGRIGALTDFVAKGKLKPGDHLGA
jgi:hypothetical protein